MVERDSLGRARRPGQQRGLRPRHPLLPDRWESRALRLAMPAADWARFEALAAKLGADAPTAARAYGEALARLMDAAALAPAPPRDPGPLDWMDWERRKTLRLLLARTA